jgi:malate dehydrogenase (quinone)
LQQPEWQDKLREMIPSYGKSLATDAQLCQQLRKHTSQVLGLKFPAMAEMVS